jgi:hypothetical protein
VPAFAVRQVVYLFRVVNVSYCEGRDRRFPLMFISKISFQTQTTKISRREWVASNGLNLNTLVHITGLSIKDILFLRTCSYRQKQGLDTLLFYKVKLLFLRACFFIFQEEIKFDY